MESVEFSASDGLSVNADLYAAPKAKAFLVLCHRSHFNRGEYAEIAPRLVELGYTCLAPDQRSGMKVLGYENGTYKRAKQKKLATGYGAARPDIEAAVDFMAKRARGKPLVLVGSSYSASLALLVGPAKPAVTAIAVFSPGEYLKGVSVAEHVGVIATPTFVTCARDEVADVRALTRRIPRALVSFYAPDSAGGHGARCMWAKSPGHEGYWKAFVKFLAQQLR